MKKLLCKIPVVKKALTKHPLVAVLRLQGIISPESGGRQSGLNLHDLAPLIEEAFQYPGVKAVALAINSPGGSPTQSALIADYITALSKEKKIPVYSFIEDVGASGGYWIACAGKEIYATPSSIVGSIGVVSAGFGFHGLLHRLGVERRLYTAGKSKAILDPFSPEKPEDVAHLKNLQQDLHRQFIDWVQTQRSAAFKARADKETIPLDDEDTIFSGLFWTGKTALELGLLDGLGSVRQVCRDKFGKKVRYKIIEPHKSFLQSLFRIEVTPDFNAIEQNAIKARFKI